jgi:NTE family protein
MEEYDIERLVDVWREMRIEKMLKLSVTQLARLPMQVRQLLKGHPQRRGLLLNSSKLQDLVVRDLPWAQVRYNLRTEVIDSLAVSATHVKSGKSTVFVDRTHGGLPPWSRDPRTSALPSRITSQHALASAAIPFLFPAIEIDGSYYCDGGVRQNTPLSPALRLGADRVLVVGLRGEDPPTRVAEPFEGHIEPYPSPMFLMGKMVDSIMLDRLDYDLKRLEGFNTLLEDGRRVFGDSFTDQINETALKMRGASYREIDTVVVRPSRDLGLMANEFVDVFRQKMGGVAGKLFEFMSDEDALGGSDLLSYLLFDGRLATAMIELGKADADAARSQLIDFFKD